jgi:hypothetical protein
VQDNYKYKPDNLLLIYSSPKVNRIAKRPAKFNKVFTVFTSQHADKHNIKINCIGRCVDCLICYNPENTIRNIQEIEKVRPRAGYETLRSKVKWEI